MYRYTLSPTDDMDIGNLRVVLFIKIKKHIETTEFGIKVVSTDNQKLSIRGN
jgi:hypothetical protein